MQKRTMRAVLSIAMLLVMGGMACGGAIEDGMFAAFETLCLPQPTSASAIENLIAPIGGRELPALQAGAFLSGREGRAWLFNDGNANFVVMFTNDEVCGLYNLDADGPMLLTLLQRYLRTREIFLKPLGSDMQEMLVTTYSSRQTAQLLHAQVILEYPTLASVRGARLTLIPQSLFQRHNLSEPEWPP